MEETGRYLSDMFLELPDKMLYPDYYDIIMRPIAIAQIECVSPSLSSNGSPEMLSSLGKLLDFI